MPDIGATLREARMRARIDIAEIETATKIRAKYLRALENEEWDLLPGPTFVKTFLRTYAEALGLDAKLLVEEYKLRHERLSDSELRPIAPRRQTTGRQGRPRPRTMGGGRGGGGGSRTLLVVVLLVAIVAILAVIGLTSGKSPDTVTTPTQTANGPTGATSSSGTAPKTARKAKTKPQRRFATLQLRPTGDVAVCLKARGQGTLIDGVTLRVGDVSRTFKSSRFELTLGNANVRLRVNGKSSGVPPTSKPVGYVITPGKGRRPLTAARRPKCP
jgi:cytoskeleton protein RodZ